MNPALTDFRIESDSVVWLALGDGRTYRLSPADLDTVLDQQDVARVRRALQERGRFMRRILPPTIMLVLAVSIVGLGSFDAHRLTSSTKAQAVTPVCIPAKAVPLPQGLTAGQLLPVLASPSPQTVSTSLQSASLSTTTSSVPAAPSASAGSGESAVRSTITPASSTSTSSTAPTLPTENSLLPQTPIQVPEVVPQTVNSLVPSVTDPLTKALTSLPLGL